MKKISIPVLLLGLFLTAPTSASASIDLGTITVPPTVTLTASPSSVQKGGSATLSWIGSSVTSCTIDNGVGAVAVSGSKSVTVTNSVTYTITCTNGTSAVSASAAITATGATVSDFGSASGVTLGTVYQATTDGFVSIPSACSGVQYWHNFLQTSSSAYGAFAEKQHDGGMYGIGSGMVYPIAKGTYWKIGDNSGATTCGATWTPIPTSAHIGAFGALQTKSAETVYQATTDGFAIMPYACNGAPQYWHDAMFIGGSASSLAEVQHQGGYYGIGSGIVMPVQAGKFWKIAGTNGTNCTGTPVYWMPLGSGTASLDAPRTMAENTTYQADTDGFVTSLYSCGGQYWHNYIKTSTDGGATWAMVQHAGGYYGEGGGMIYPVKKGQYWRFEGCAGGAGALTWIPFYGLISPPGAVTFSAAPASVVKGSSSTLSWTATNVSSCTGTNFSAGTVANNGLTGSANVSPQSTTTYTLTCTGLDGATITKSATVTVTVNTNPPTASLSGAPSSIILGGTSLLTWSSTNSNSCTGSGFSTGGATSGTKLVGPTSDTNYAVTCTNTNTSATASKAITVAVKQPSASISSSVGRAKKGDTVTISWNAQNVTACTITGSGIGTNGTKTVTAAADGTVTGSQDVVIQAQSTYIISCSPSGSSSQSAAVVNLAPDFQEF